MISIPYPDLIYEGKYKQFLRKQAENREVANWCQIKKMCNFARFF